ncbi:MAG TPA: DNA-3-methyladenine glycosylase [Gemmatimonadales bacterium]|jgi:DNA-3-methyladenine glycosylase II|nr:DNA-3-methyladenine glycosylase [Gemmatimonadales bacterium]
MASTLVLPRQRRSDGLEYDPAVACRYLTQADPQLGALIVRVGEFAMRPRIAHSLFVSLLRSIVYQQLSGKAAATILGRVVRLTAPRRFPTPHDLLQLPPERLREAGLSAAKAAAVRDLAARTLDGTVPPLARIRRMEDEEIIERLTLVRGIGRWTVEMLLIFRLGRPDVLPVDDLGVRKGFARVFRKGKLPEPAAMLRRAEAWRPYRSVATWYLYRALEL